MISPSSKIEEERQFDPLLRRCLQNWSSRKHTQFSVASGRRYLLVEVARYGRQYQGWSGRLMFKYLPSWLRAYVFDNNWFFGTSEMRNQAHGVIYRESSYSIMVYLCRVGISAA